MPVNQYKIKTIIFDFMGVLLFQRNDYQPDETIDEIDTAIGKVTNDELFKKEVMKKYNLNEEDFDVVLNKIIDKYTPFESLWDLLPELKKKYRLVIINNGTALTLSRLKNKYHIDDIFNLFISSAIEGLKKPDKNIYELTVKKLGVKSEECLFMDDSKLNTEGAKKCGMKTIWWKNQKDGFAKFKEFLATN